MPLDRQKLFLEGPIGTALVRLAIPIILGNVLQTGCWAPGHGPRAAWAQRLASA
jgi:hypothetical protein